MLVALKSSDKRGNGTDYMRPQNGPDDDTHVTVIFTHLGFISIGSSKWL